MVNGNQQLPDGWTTERIGDICFVTKLAGFEFTKHVKYVDDGEIPVIRAQNVTRQGFQEGNFIYVKRDVFELLTRSRLVGDEVLMAFVGSVGNVGIVPKGKEYFLGPNVALIRVDESRVFNKFLYYYLSSEAGKSSVLKFSKSTTQSSISMANIRDVHFPLPPLPEQERIVAKIEELFTQLEAGTSALERVQAGLRRYKASVLKAAVEGKLVEQDENDEPASELLTRILAGRKKAIPTPEISELPDLPKGWVWSTLAQLIDHIEAGHSFKAQGRPATSNELGVIKVSAMSWEEFLPNENKALFPDTDPENTPSVKAGDLLLSRANTVELVGAVVLVERDYPNLLLSDKSLRLVPASEEISKQYLLYALRTKSVRDVYEREATGTSDSMRNLSQDKILMPPIPLPPLEEQRRIVAEVERRLSVAREVETVVEKALARSTRLRQAVLKSAFEGRLA